LTNYFPVGLSGLWIDLALLGAGQREIDIRRRVDKGQTTHQALTFALQGLDGGVVPSIVKRTRGIEIDNDHLIPVTVEPADFGLDHSENPELPLFGPHEEGQGASDNPVLCKAAGDMTRAVLSGEMGAPRNATLLSAALMLKASGRCLTIAEGVDAATTAVDSGAALERVERLRSLLS